MTRQTRERFTSASIVLYLASMPFETLCQNGNCNAWPAYSVLLFGLIPFLATPANFAWMANPALFISWAIFAFDKNEESSKIRIALSVFGSAASILPLIFRRVVMNEAGLVLRIEGFGLGYWLWLVAMILNLTAAAGTPVRAEEDDLP